MHSKLNKNNIATDLSLAEERCDVLEEKET